MKIKTNNTVGKKQNNKNKFRANKQTEFDLRKFTVSISTFNYICRLIKIIRITKVKELTNKMKRMVRYIFTKAIIILMTFFVCLPCSAKKEFKQILEIPFSDLEASEKPNKNSICQTFTKSEKTKLSTSNQKKSLQKWNYNCDLTVILHKTLNLHFNPFLNFQIASSVPIYILHEQYLI